MIKTLRFGIEIETVGRTLEQVARVIQDVLNVGAAPGLTRMVERRSEGYGSEKWFAFSQDGREWASVPDGSLSGIGAEIVSPILTYTDMETLQDIVRSVRKSGSRVDESCGIHVHVDGARFNAKTLANLVKIVHKQEALLEAAIQLAPRRRTSYAKPVTPNFMAGVERSKPSTMSELRALWYANNGDCNIGNQYNPRRYDRSRYQALNLNSYFVRGSIEFRYFNGTLHAGEVKTYIQLCLGLAAKALTSKSTSSKRRAYNPATAKYDFRVLLLSLGFIGEEFATARGHLTKHLAGSSAWQGERRDTVAARAARTVDAVAAL